MKEKNKLEKYEERKVRKIYILAIIPVTIVAIHMSFAFFFFPELREMSSLLITLLLNFMAVVGWIAIFSKKIIVYEEGIKLVAFPRKFVFLPFKKIKKIEVKKNRARIYHGKLITPWFSVKNPKKFIQIVKKYALEKLEVIE